MTRPLFSYYGGKQRLASKIMKHFPPHSVYVEPFAGGAALLFAKPDTNTNYYQEVLNDNNQLIHRTYRYCRDNPEDFDKLIEYTPFGMDVYREARVICRDPQKFLDRDVAWAFFVNINQSFTNKLNAGWSRSFCGRNLAGTWDLRRSSLPVTLQRLKSVSIESLDAIECIKKWDSPQTLFYCDPPYPNANQGHYGGYTIEDFDILCKTLDSIQGSYVLSNYDQKEIYPKTATRYELAAYCSADGKGKIKGDRTRKATSEEMGDRKRIEVLWVCDRSGNVREELKSVLAKNSSRLLEVIGEAD
jgi:DNA adenine methylase